MISELCYAIVFVIETIISIFYFNNKFKLKRNKEMIFLVAFISSVISFSVAKLNTPALNLLSFFVCNFLILILCYEVNIKSSLFHSFLSLEFKTLITRKLEFLISIEKMINLFSDCFAASVAFAIKLSNKDVISGSLIKSS